MTARVMSDPASQSATDRVPADGSNRWRLAPHTGPVNTKAAAPKLGARVNPMRSWGEKS